MVECTEKSAKGLLSAEKMMEKLALAEAEKATEAARSHAAAEAEKKALLDKLLAPSGVSEEERMKRASAIIERAVSNGLTEVLVMRFPNSLTTDRGRAINQLEAGWENTLTGCRRSFMTSGTGSSAHSDTRSGFRSSIGLVECRGTSASR